MDLKTRIERILELEGIEFHEIDEEELDFFVKTHTDHGKYDLSLLYVDTAKPVNVIAVECERCFTEADDDEEPRISSSVIFTSIHTKEFLTRMYTQILRRRTYNE